MATAVKKSGKTLADLRAIHDKAVVVPNKIRAALAKMAQVSWQEWEYDEDFRKLAGLNPVDLRDYREEFKDFWTELPPTNGKRDARKVWFATKKAADAWKGQ